MNTSAPRVMAPRTTATTPSPTSILSSRVVKLPIQVHVRQTPATLVLVATTNCSILRSGCVRLAFVLELPLNLFPVIDVSPRVHIIPDTPNNTPLVPSSTHCTRLGRKPHPIATLLPTPKVHTLSISKPKVAALQTALLGQESGTSVPNIIVPDTTYPPAFTAEEHVPAGKWI